MNLATMKESGTERASRIAGLPALLQAAPSRFDHHHHLYAPALLIRGFLFVNCSWNLCGSKGSSYPAYQNIWECLKGARVIF